MGQPGGMGGGFGAQADGNAGATTGMGMGGNLDSPRQGTLEHYTSGKFGMKGWQKRLISIERSGQVKAYKKSVAEESQNTWTLVNCQEAKMLPSSFKGRKVVWKLVVTELELYYFATNTAQEADAWVNDVNRAIREAKGL
jgi:PH domain